MKCKISALTLLSLIIGTGLGVIFYFAPSAYTNFGVRYALICAAVAAGAVYLTSLLSGLTQRREFCACKGVGILLSVLAAAVVVLAVPSYAFTGFSTQSAYAVLRFLLSYAWGGVIVFGVSELVCLVKHS